MNAADKERFINELMDSVKDTLLGNVEIMPEEWDGHELRHYIAYKFAESTYKMPPNRMRAFKNSLLVSNL